MPILIDQKHRLGAMPLNAGIQSPIFTQRRED